MTGPQLTSQPEADLIPAIEATCRAHLLREVGRHAYSVDHDVIREVVETSLSTARLAELHRRIADTLERSFPAIVRQQPAQIAWHFLEADEPARALPYVLLAGDQAEALFAHQDAGQHYRKAVELAGDLDDHRGEAQALHKLGIVLSRTVQYPLAMAALERAFELSHEEGDLTAEAETVASISRLHVLTGTPQQGLRRLESFLQRFGTNQSSTTLAHLYASQAQCYHATGQFTRELQAAHQASTHARTASDEVTLAETEVRRGLALFALGRNPEGRQVVEAAIPLVERCGDLDTLTVALRELGWAHLVAGHYERAKDCRQRALEAAEQLGDPARIAVELANLAMISISGGEWTEAAHLVDRALGIARSLNTPPSAAYPLFVAGTLGLLTGRDMDEASRLLDECASIALQSGDVGAFRQVQWALAERDMFFGHADQSLSRFQQFADFSDHQYEEGAPIPYLLRILAALYVAVGDAEKAEPMLKESILLSERDDDKLNMVEGLRVLGMAKVHQGQWEEAGTALCHCRDLARQGHYPFGEARALFEHGQLLNLMRDAQAARTRLAEAYSMFHRLGASPYLERIEQALSVLADT